MTRLRLATGRPALGMTLIELLVVMFIIITITAMAIPLMTPDIAGRRIREAARQVEQYLSGARDRASQRERPVGVVLERDPDADPINGEGAIRLVYAEMPIPWSGDTVSSAVTVTTASNGLTATIAPANFTNFRTQDVVPSGMLPTVRPYDLIQLNHRSSEFVITNATGSSLTISVGSNANAQQIPRYVDASGTPVPVPFKVLRQPRRTNDPPLQLPAELAIDLFYSGSETISFANSLSTSGNAANAPDGDVILMFAPEGSLDLVYRLGATETSYLPQRSSGPVSLLIGKREHLIRASRQLWNSDGIPQQNVSDLENLWVTVFPDSGRVKTDEVASIGFNTALDPTDLDDYANLVRQARTYAVSAEAIGD